MTKLVRNATAKSQATAHKAPRRNGLHSKSKYGKRKEYLTQIDLGNQPDAITITPKSVAKLIQRRQNFHRLSRSWPIFHLKFALHAVTELAPVAVLNTV